MKRLAGDNYISFIQSVYHLLTTEYKNATAIDIAVNIDVARSYLKRDFVPRKITETLGILNCCLTLHTSHNLMHFFYPQFKEKEEALYAIGFIQGDREFGVQAIPTDNGFRFVEVQLN